MTDTLTQKKYDGVLLDDDLLIRLTWKLRAETTQKNLLIFEKPEPLFEMLAQIDPSTAFYIDSALSDQVRGEDVAQKLYQLGFQNISLVTGYPASTFAPVQWIRQVLGKDPPW